MNAATPEQFYEAFQEAFNAGDLDRMMALYERDAALVAQPGQVMSGTEQVREGLKGFLALNGRATLKAKDVVQAGDVALGAAKWSVSGTGADGNPVAMGGISADVLRRGADGTWRYVIDQPWGDQVMKTA